MRVAFYKSKKHLFNRLVAWWTQGPYSHCEVVLGQEGDEYICASASGRDGGVRFKTMQLPADTWDIVDVAADFRSIFAWFHDHKGQKYDVLGLFGFIGRRGTQDQAKWFCSEACAAALGYAEPWRYDPNGFYQLLQGRHHG
jgi:hypothetical protein